MALSESANELYIVKIGGNIIDDDAQLGRFLHNFSQLKGKKILVHGGGKLATELADRLAIPQQMIHGRRITDAETLKIITMVYAGYINKNVVAALQHLGCNAIGLSGADGNLILAEKRKATTIDYGFAGDVQQVNTELITRLLNDHYLPVIAPVTHNGEGQLLNTNADTIAQEIARALAPFYRVNLLYTFEKSGVLLDAENESTVIPNLSRELFVQLIAEKRIFQGMIPKLENAFEALGSGVKRVLIGKAEALDDLVAGRAGTTIS